MITCKACNKPIEGEGKFCSERCAKDFVATLNKVNSTAQRVKKKGEDSNKYSFGWECVLQRRGRFFISNISLERIRDSVSKNAEFEMLLSSQGLMVVRLSDELLVIKKSIL